MWPLENQCQFGFASVDIGFLGSTISHVTLSCCQYLYNSSSMLFSATSCSTVCNHKQDHSYRDSYRVLFHSSTIVKIRLFFYQNLQGYDQIYMIRSLYRMENHHLWSGTSSQCFIVFWGFSVIKHIKFIQRRHVFYENQMRWPPANQINSV